MGATTDKVKHSADDLPEAAATRPARGPAADEAGREAARAQARLYLDLWERQVMQAALHARPLRPPHG